MQSINSVVADADKSTVKASAIFWPFCLSFLFASLLALSAFAIHLDVRIFQNDMGEASIIEVGQEAYLLIAVILFGLVAIKDESQRGFAVLVTGFFATIFIREMDGILDAIRHGIWKYPAWLVSVSAIGYSIFHLKTTTQPLVRFTSTPAFGMMVGGVFTLLVFSRIYGMNILWQAAMGEHLDPAIKAYIKTMAEEGVELLAYSLILFASAWYTLPCLFKRR
ncbi:hypothetical protein [Photobacterium sp. GSS17]|uniref:hypothetical protein n=1 Tax=Photobacterium sp. GSS17 TaxID=3020715 RepID=UPI00235F665A|nr:hypothetical protein [Photobacterium sp. GSS17]